MRKALKLLPVLAVAALPFGPLLAEGEPTAETVVATVDGTDITLGHMMVMYNNLPDQYRQIPIERLFDGILEQLIQQEALSQNFKGTPPKALVLSMENEERAMRAAADIQTYMESAVTEAAIEAMYDEKYAQGEGEQEYNASHILVASEDEAKAIRQVLIDGADFAEVARTSSTGPSGPNGGALGWFTAGQMVPPFEEAVMALEPGDISEPVETRFGWHVITLNESRIADAPELDEVRAEIVGELEAQAIEDHVTALTKEAKIDRADLSTLDPAVLGQPELLE